jgi:hypothetical protein
MSIPSCILLSNDKNIISNTTIQNHQNFAKNLLKLRNNYIKKNKRKSSISDLNFESLTTLGSEENRKIIFEWFSDLPLDKKIQLCSINNKWLSKIINQLLLLYYKNDSITLSPCNDFQEFFEKKNDKILQEKKNDKNNNKNDLDFYTTFLLSDYKENNNNIRYDKYQKKYLINNIKFFTFEEGNDTISLNKSFLENPGRIKESFDYFSESNFLKSWLIPYYNENYQLFNFKFPYWLRKKSRFSLYDILVGYIEQNIILNYEYYYYSNKMYDNKLGDKIIEIEELNNKLENFMSVEYTNSFVFDSIDFDKIEENIEKFNKINNEIINQVNILNKVYDKIIEDKHYPKSNSYNEKPSTKTLLINAKEKMNDYYSDSINCFLYNITFLNVEDALGNLRPIYYFIYNYIKETFQNKNANELIEEMENYNKKKRHKKKKNKNKNKKKENQNKEKINDNLNNKEIVENNKVIKNKDENIKENINEINKNTETNLNIIQENTSNQKGKKKKKEKEFFLFPTQKKKKEEI